MKVLFCAACALFCSGCAAVTPAMVLSGVMGLAEHGQNNRIEGRLARVEALLVEDRGTGTRSSSPFFHTPLAGLRVRVVEP